jgi:hypothetical protein
MSRHPTRLQPPRRRTIGVTISDEEEERLDEDQKDDGRQHRERDADAAIDGVSPQRQEIPSHVDRWKSSPSREFSVA